MPQLDNLEPEFFNRLLETVELCKKYDTTVIPYQGIRTPHEQARLWRRGRTTAFIEQEIAGLRNNGAEYLASLIEQAGKQKGKRVTGAMPGYSWHQYGKACDFYVQDENEEPIWDSAHDGYQVLCECAEECGLVSGHRWKMKDSVHVQMNNNKIAQIYSLKEVDQEMKTRFNG